MVGSLAEQTQAAGLHLNREVKFGDLLTSVTVLVSALTLSYSFWKDRLQHRREQADAVRTAAAEALARLNRYARLPESLDERMQGLAVKTSKQLANHKNVGQARDFLWEELNNVWRDVRATQRAEGIELAHVKLYGHRPDAYVGMAAALSQLDVGGRKCFYDLLLRAQDKVFAYQGRLWDYQPARFGDDLRGVLSEFRGKLNRSAEEALKPVRDRLEAVICGDDKQVLDRGWDSVAGATKRAAGGSHG